MRKLFFKLILALSLLWYSILLSQNTQSKLEGKALIDSLLNSESIESAREEIDKQIEFYFDNHVYDSLPSYVKLIGSRILTNNNWEKALSNAENYVAKIASIDNKVILKNAYLELANLYDDKGDPETAYQKAELALKLAKEIKDPKKADLEGVHYNLGTKAFNMGDIALSKMHQLKNLAFRKKSSDQNHEMYYYTYNSMGRLMWFSGRPDSAMYYFKEAIASAIKLDTTPWNQYFRPALLNGNIAVLLQAQGNVEEAISVTQEAVRQLEFFDQLSTNEADKLNALKQKLASIDNLGVYHNSIGEYEEAERLITHSFEEKKKNLDPDDINITISHIILGQANMGTRRFKEAEKNLLKAIERLEKSPNKNYYYQGFSETSLASVYEALQDYEKAAEYFAKGEISFRQTLSNGYTKDFLDELADMALFNSKRGDKEKAKSLTNDIYNYVHKGSFNGSLQHYKLLLTKTEVHQNLGEFQKALDLATEGLHFFENVSTSKTVKDSVLIQFDRPRNLLLYVKNKYSLENNKDEEVYKDLIGDLNEALEILNQRKTILKSYEDLNLLVRENDAIFSLLAKLYKEVYDLTKKTQYLNKLLSIKESSIYTKIRTRLNLKKITFAKIPDKVLNRERKLKYDLEKSIDLMKDFGTEPYFKAEHEWSQFQDSIKSMFPEYYNLRYGRVTEDLGDLKDLVPKGTTLVRYLFVDDLLLAYVNDGSKENLVEIETDLLKDNIRLITNFSNEEKTVQTLNSLYKQLWEPIENLVTQKRVIIFPDAELFNLSFELLTPRKVNSFDELISTCLLAKHTFSYNYSLLLLQNNREPLQFENDFIAFAPEFNEHMKKNYYAAIADSLYLDKTYLTLLPQPFSSDLVKKFGEKLNGRSFLNENASKQLFTKNAKEHKIIHIGTHAESNNVSPELSRLVFAKNVTDTVNINDNYLYTYEIYNQNLSSNLAILTACETGKPTYQPGEGMISLAHAFNYAGSESILTSLWQIDEKSSAEILEYFYDFLSGGKAKDEALKQAKLKYLKNNEGRTFHPQYWAGLILMGDTSPIELHSSTNWWLWILAGLFVAFVVVIFLKKRKTSHSI